MSDGSLLVGVVSAGVAVGSSVAAGSMYGINTKSGLTSFTLPSSSACIKAVVYASSSSATYCGARSLGKFIIGTSIVTFTHISDVCPPTRHSVTNPNERAGDA